MALRVPKAELPTELRENMIKQFGAVPEPVEVVYNNPDVAMSSLDFSAKVAAWDAADESLKTFAHMAVAAQVGCSWCLDINYFQALNQNLDLTKASQVPRWRESDVFTPLERDVLAVRRGHDEHAADRHRRALGESAGAAGPGGDGRAHRVSSRLPTCRPGPTRRTGSRRRATPTRATFHWPRRPENSGVASTA